MDFEESMNFLRESGKFGIGLGLTRIKELLRRLDYAPGKTEFIHISGTKGKGSVSALLFAMLCAAGHTAGFFSSPHLHSYCERIRTGKGLIKPQEVAELMTLVRPHVLAMGEEGFEPPTEFEITTVLALLFFAAKKLEKAVVEVGLGGRTDSTNVIAAKTALITPIGMDHMDYLGHTIEAIASAKAGIIKPGAMVFASAGGEALEVIEKEAVLQKAKLCVYPRDFGAEKAEFSGEGQYFDFVAPDARLERLFIPLLGEHQIDNAALAVAAARHLGLAEREIRQGLAQALWPARLEVFSRRPLVVLDGAHNRLSMEALAKALERHWPDKKVVAVLGMLSDKEPGTAAAPLLPHLEYAFISQPISERASSGQELLGLCHKHGVPCQWEENIETACAKALAVLREDEMLLVTGSFYLVAPVREFLLKKREDL
ncbi:MAG: bifunctional folylpolyglutamate synthase/dihydrofolate synthase [Clostridiales bacterium]|nr:bifunctional folylpolyglutamate synthase/dihydrofolate synthase [Clostridiales bacterium]